MQFALHIEMVEPYFPNFDIFLMARIIFKTQNSIDVQVVMVIFNFVLWLTTIKTNKYGILIKRSAFFKKSLVNAYFFCSNTAANKS